MLAEGPLDIVSDTEEEISLLKNLEIRSKALMKQMIQFLRLVYDCGFLKFLNCLRFCFHRDLCF